MSKTIENLKSGNYEVVDNQGVSVTQHFIECLEKEFADLEAKLKESEKDKQEFKTMYFHKCLEYGHLYEKFVDKCNEFELKEYDYKQTIYEKDQDKISFTIEQLEKVKAELVKLGQDYSLNLCGIKIYNFIDNQIKQLKEMKQYD